MQGQVKSLSFLLEFGGNMNILKLISSRDYGVYNKSIARIYGVEIAIVLGELASEYDYYESIKKLEDGEWFYSTSENIENNTSLTYYQQNKAINKLIELKIIEQKRAGIPAKRYFKFNKKELEQFMEKVEIYFSKNSNTSFQKTSKLDVKNFELNNNNNINNKSNKEYIPPHDNNININKNTNTNKNTNNNKNNNSNTNNINNTNINSNINNNKVIEDKESNSDNNLFDYIQNNFGRLLSPIEYEKISTWEDNKVTRHAVEVAILNNKHSISYVEGILRRYKDNDVSTLEQAKEYDDRLKNKSKGKETKDKTECTYPQPVETEPNVWCYSQNGSILTCSEPYQYDGKWVFKNVYGEIVTCKQPRFLEK